MFKLDLSFQERGAHQNSPAKVHSWQEIINCHGRKVADVFAYFQLVSAEQQLDAHWECDRLKRKVCCGPVFQVCSSLNVSQKPEQKGGEAGGQRARNNHRGSGPVGKFVIYTMPRVLPVCFIRVVWNIQ